MPRSEKRGNGKSRTIFAAFEASLAPAGAPAAAQDATLSIAPSIFIDGYRIFGRGMTLGNLVHDIEVFDSGADAAAGIVRSDSPD